MATLTMGQVMAENAALKARLASRSVLTVKIKSVADGGKGTVCVYGLGRRPVALYAGQWTRLLAFAPNIAEFIASKPEGMSVRETDA